MRGVDPFADERLGPGLELNFLVHERRECSLREVAARDIDRTDLEPTCAFHTWPAAREALQYCTHGSERPDRRSLRMASEDRRRHRHPMGSAMLRNTGSLAFVLALSGCTEARSGQPLETASVTQGAGESPDRPIDTDDVTSTDGPATTGSTKLDVGVDTAASDGYEDTGCSAVDLLFVIDRSESMDEEQTNLIASVPKWIDAIETQLPEASDYHVMAVDMDDRWGTPYCDGCSSGCTYDNGAEIWEVPDYPCAHAPSACDAALGAGRIINGGYRASNGECDFPDGRRWLRYDDEGVEDKFACAARVGVSGPGNEQPTSALAAAVGPSLAASGGCNEGFIRNEALLVVVLVTDEDEGDFVGEELFDEVVAPRVVASLVDLKGGDADGVVMIALLDDFELGPDAQCQSPAFPLNFGPAPHLRSFTEQFPRHFFGSVCAPDYSIPLVAAIDTIAEACVEYVPAG